MSELYDPTKNKLVTKEDIEDHNAVGMIVKNPDKPDHIALFFHQKYQFWTIPIGKSAIGKELIDTVCEESMEELGIKIKECQDIGHFRKTYNRGSGILTTINSHIFDITAYDNEPINVEIDKHTAMIWCTVDKIVKLSLTGRVSDMTMFYLNLLMIQARVSIKLEENNDI